MPASLLTQTLSSAAATNLTASSTPTSTPSPASAYQPPQWDAVAVYGLIFGLLAVVLAIPGTYLAIIALKRHRAYEARQYAMNDIEPVIEMQTSGLGSVGSGTVGVDRLDGEADK